ncbi:uncharacterized protein LOC130761375 [Actinidia eriantha]|uniref:uncharacterized protein LOC130761375 n=1 Tax=Actinidia eriantha TaxID=165200 RepID=UPI002590C77C|nr:uncharacterized protein LOC130761375 [Actinidia eriantha]
MIESLLNWAKFGTFEARTVASIEGRPHPSLQSCSQVRYRVWPATSSSSHPHIMIIGILSRIYTLGWCLISISLFKFSSSSSSSSSISADFPTQVQNSSIQILFMIFCLLLIGICCVSFSICRNQIYIYIYIFVCCKSIYIVRTMEGSQSDPEAEWSLPGGETGLEEIKRHWSHRHWEHSTRSTSTYVVHVPAVFLYLTLFLYLNSY